MISPIPRASDFTAIPAVVAPQTPAGTSGNDPLTAENHILLQTVTMSQLNAGDFRFG